MERVSAARERLQDLKRELSASDLFCVDCRYLRGADCIHPALKLYSVDPVSGTVDGKPCAARFARSSDGGCGPEAALFDPHPTPLVVAKATWGGFLNAMAVVVVAMIVIGLAAQLLS